MRLPTVLAGAALALLPAWWHIDLVDPGLHGIIAVFGEVAVYPSDVCLAALAIAALSDSVPLGGPRRWLAFGLTLLAVAALASSLRALDPLLAAGVAAHLALLTLAWIALSSGGVSRTVLAGSLVAAATLQAILAVAQFIFQQPVIPPVLHLPWLPSDASQSGTPVILNSTGDRLLRGFGTFPHPNILGGYLAMALACLPVLQHRWPRRAPVWLLVGCAISLGLIASFSRAAWLASVIGLGIWWWTNARPGHARWRMPTIVALGAAAIACTPIAPMVGARLFPFGSESNVLERGSVENRLALDRDAVVGLSRHIPGGIGGGNYGKVAVAEGQQEGWGEPVPNVVLLIAHELGMPGVFALVVIIFGAARVLRASSGIDVAAMSACVALVVLATLDHYLWTMPIGRTIAWVPCALIAARPNRQRAQLACICTGAPGWAGEPGTITR